MEESTATQHDVTPEEGAVEPDPFAEVPADLGEEEGLPPNVQPGSLGGDNPSEVPEAEAEPPAAPVEEEAAPDPLAEEPMGGEFMEEPPEPDFEPEAAAAPPEAEAPPVPADEPPVAEQPPEAEPKPEPKKRSRKPRKKKAEKGQRGYVILRLDARRQEAVVGAAECPGWVEAFEREIPIGEKGSKPVTIDSRSAEMALRVAYRRLTENGEASMWLVPVPAKLFKPKHVEGKVPENALTIKVN